MTALKLQRSGNSGVKRTLEVAHDICVRNFCTDVSQQIVPERTPCNRVTHSEFGCEEQRWIECKALNMFFILVRQ